MTIQNTTQSRSGQSLSIRDWEIPSHQNTANIANNTKWSKQWDMIKYDSLRYKCPNEWEITSGFYSQEIESRLRKNIIVTPRANHLSKINFITNDYISLSVPSSHSTRLCQGTNNNTYHIKIWLYKIIICIEPSRTLPQSLVRYGNQLSITLTTHGKSTHKQWHLPRDLTTETPSHRTHTCGEDVRRVRWGQTPKQRKSNYDQKCDKSGLWIKWGLKYKIVTTINYNH